MCVCACIYVCMTLYVANMHLGMNVFVVRQVDFFVAGSKVYF